MTDKTTGRVGFIGLGTMGRAMARNLMEAGHELTVYDVDASAVAGLAAKGATAAGGVGEAATGIDIVTTRYVDARAHGEGSNNNQALFKVYERMTGQRSGAVMQGAAP